MFLFQHFGSFGLNQYDHEDLKRDENSDELFSELLDKLQGVPKKHYP